MTRKSKFRFLIPALLIFLSSASYAQHLELTAFGGGTFAAGLNNYSTYYHKAQIGGSWHFGGALDFFLQPNASINITVYDQPTTGYLYGNAGYKNVSTPMSMTYILAGFNRYVGQEKVHGFGGIGLGAVIIAASGYSSATKFAIDLHAGVKFDASDHVGIRLQVQLDAPVDGGGFGIGTGGVGVSTYSSIFQFGGNLGIVFRFGQKK
jgi:hypothetical protein